FFFSSRRRHTRFSRDWSSDVCSSDLYSLTFVVRPQLGMQGTTLTDRARVVSHPSDEYDLVAANDTTSVDSAIFGAADLGVTISRSEERRVGKGGKSWRGAEPFKRVST